MSTHKTVEQTMLVLATPWIGERGSEKIYKWYLLEIGLSFTLTNVGSIAHKAAEHNTFRKISEKTKYCDELCSIRVGC